MNSQKPTMMIWLPDMQASAYLLDMPFDPYDAGSFLGMTNAVGLISCVSTP